MKCNCKTCGGTGKVECDECDGAGREEMSLENIKLDKNHKNFAELCELVKDSARIKSQAAELRKLNPARAASYIAQEKAALDVVDRQAERLFGGK